MEYLLFGTMVGPLQEHVWPIYTSKMARALKFASLGKHGLKKIFFGVSNFGTMTGLVWIMFGLTLF